MLPKWLVRPRVTVSSLFFVTGFFNFSQCELFHRVQYGGGQVLQPLIADRRTNSSPLGATGDVTCNLLAD